MEQPSTISTSAPTLMNHAIRFGVMLAVIAIIITLVIYAIDYTWLVSFKMLGLILVLFLGFVIYAGLNYRQENGGYLSYGKAFQHGFVLLATAGLINIVFGIILYNVIDPDMPEKLTDVIAQNTEEMMTGFGAPADQIDEQIDKLRAEQPDKFRPVGQLISYLYALIVYAVVSAITALFVRKNEPEVL